MEVIFPLILSVSGYAVLKKIKSFDFFNVWEKILLIFAGTVSATGILISYIGQFSPIGIKTPFLIIFCVSILLLLISIKDTCKGVIRFLCNIFLEKKLLSIVVAAVIIKIIAFFILHPVIDPDIVSQYLTFSRSIVLNNRTPAVDNFTLNPSTTPPIGAPIIFSYYYVISGNLKSEGFVLYTIPFFFGITIITYLISKKLFNGNDSFAKLTVLTFLLMPLVDTMLLEWTLYPDIIAVFLQLTVIYFFFFSQKALFGKNNFAANVVIGLSIAEILLLKNQSPLFFMMVATLVLIRGRLFDFRTHLLGVLLTFLLLFTSTTNLLGSNFFRLGKGNPLMDFIVALPVILMLFTGNFTKQTVKINAKSALIILGLGTVGFLWLGRNYILYKSFLSVGNAGIYKNIIFQHDIFLNGMAENLKIIDLQSFNSLALFLLPVFGSFFIIPKIIGILHAIRKTMDWNMAVLISLYWYALVIIYSGFPNERYLLLILPFICMFTILGIKDIIGMIFRNFSVQKKELLCSLIVIIFAIFSLSQSILLSWGYGSVLFTPSKMREIAFSNIQYSEQISSNTIKQMLERYSLESIRVLNIRLGTFTNKDVLPLAILVISVSIFIFIFTKFICNNISDKNVSRIILLLTPLLLVPYLVLVLLVSGTRIGGFSKFIEKNLYSFWGESKTIVPYFIGLEDKTPIILAIGPQTGLAYKINMNVYNIEYGYGFLHIMPIIYEKNEKLIYNYFQNNNIKYVLVYVGADNSIYLSNFKQNSTLYEFILDSKYFSVEIESDGNNLWKLYKLKGKV